MKIFHYQGIFTRTNFIEIQNMSDLSTESHYKHAHILYRHTHTHLGKHICVCVCVCAPVHNLNCGRRRRRRRLSNFPEHKQHNACISVDFLGLFSLFLRLPLSMFSLSLSVCVRVLVFFLPPIWLPTIARRYKHLRNQLDRKETGRKARLDD